MSKHCARVEWFFGNVFSYVSAARNSHQRDSVRVDLNVSNGEAIVGIHDTGIGIAVEMLGCIFDLFVQLTEALDRSEGGLGIGLILVKAIIEHHGGTIDEHSDGPGQGSEFTFRIPLLTAPGTNGVSSKPHRERSAFELPQELNTAIIEGNVDGHSTLQTLLELDCHQFRSAGDGVQVVDLVLSWGSDIAVVDVGLPGLDRFEVARKILATSGVRLSSPFLIALTCYGLPADREKVLVAGFDRQLVKPLNPLELTEILVILRSSQNKDSERTS